MVPVLVPPLPALKPSGKPAGVVLRQQPMVSAPAIGMTEEERTARAHALAESKKRQGEEGMRWQPPAFPEMPVSPVAPVAPYVGQLWHRTSVNSETVPKPERVLRWDGTDWVIAGLVSDSATIMKQGMQVCDFQEALADAHASMKWLDCVYTGEWAP
jgi:hypothetical protein